MFTRQPLVVLCGVAVAEKAAAEALEQWAAEKATTERAAEVKYQAEVTATASWKRHMRVIV